MIDAAQVPALRAALTSASYTVDAVYALLGDDAHSALGRNQTVPALRATRDDSDLATLVRLFALQVAVDRSRADHALPGLVDDNRAGRRHVPLRLALRVGAPRLLVLSGVYVVVGLAAIALVGATVGLSR